VSLLSTLKSWLVTWGAGAFILIVLAALFLRCGFHKHYNAPPISAIVTVVGGSLSLLAGSILLYASAQNLNPADLSRSASVIGGVVIVVVGYNSIKYGFGKCAPDVPLPSEQSANEEESKPNN
jgi:peptidoglycan/LPS O-acetylase OafA/YrhL